MVVRYLDVGQLRSLTEAAIDLGLHERRDVLLASIDRRFTSTLKLADNPHDQLRLDLDELNRTEKLSDGTVPLMSWLEDAIAAARGRNTEALERAFAWLDPKLPRPERWTWTPPAEFPERKERVIPPDGRVPFDFLNRGRAAGASVALVSVRRYDHQQPSSSPPVIGTGWMIGPQLIVTSHHVVNARHDGEADASSLDLRKQASTATATFDYDSEDRKGRQIAVKSLEAFDPELDFAILRLETDPGVPPLELAEHPPYVDELHHPPLNIIQHPQGRPKEVALRSNLATTAKGRPSDLGYFSDTEAGSSGAPVFDDNWRVVAIHRAWAPAMTVESFQGLDRAIANVGTRMDKIREHLQEKHVDLWRAISTWPHRTGNLEPTSDAKATPLRAVGLASRTQTDTDGHPSRLGDLAGILAESVERVRNNYAAGRGADHWAEAELVKLIEQLRRSMDGHLSWLSQAGLDHHMSTLDLRILLSSYAPLTDVLVSTLRELGREPPSIVLLARFDETCQSLEELLQGIHLEAELAGPDRLPPPG